MNETKSKEMRRGVNILVVLAVLTAVEFGLALVVPIWELLVVAALIKAILVIYNYMHFPRLWAEGGGH